MSIRDLYNSKVEQARELNVSTRTLDRWWAERRGPPRTKIGKQVMYRKDSTAKWLLSKEAVAIRDQPEAA